MIRTLSTISAGLLCSVLAVSSASAGTVIADYNADGVWTSYDANDGVYGMKFRSDLGKDGFWLVVTDGANPKGDGNSHAILYGDIKNNRITAYKYDGENNAKSFQSGTLLGTYENVFVEAGSHERFGYDTTVFSLDVSSINSSLTDGIQIGDQAGIWFHQSTGSDFQYDVDGSILSYTFTDQMYLDDGFKATYTLDCANRPDVPSCFAATSLNSGGSLTTISSGGGSVPAPGGLALILVGFAALGRRFYRTKS